MKNSNKISPGWEKFFSVLGETINKTLNPDLQKRFDVGNNHNDKDKNMNNEKFDVDKFPQLKEDNENEAFFQNDSEDDEEDPENNIEKEDPESSVKMNRKQLHEIEEQNLQNTTIKNDFEINDNLNQKIDKDDEHLTNINEQSNNIITNDIQESPENQIIKESSNSLNELKDNEDISKTSLNTQNNQEIGNVSIINKENNFSESSNFDDDSSNNQNDISKKDNDESDKKSNKKEEEKHKKIISRLNEETLNENPNARTESINNMNTFDNNDKVDLNLNEESENTNENSGNYQNDQDDEKDEINQDTDNEVYDTSLDSSDKFKQRIIQKRMIELESISSQKRSNQNQKINNDDEANDFYCGTCHKYAHCINDTCQCDEGLDGDGYKLCYHKILQIKSIFPESPSVGTPIIISFVEKPHWSASYPSCKFGKYETKASFEDNSVYVCSIPNDYFFFFKRFKTIDVQVSIDRIKWSEPYNLTVYPVYDNYHQAIALIKHYSCYAIAFCIGFSVIFLGLYISEQIRLKKISLSNPFEADILYA